MASELTCIFETGDIIEARTFKSILDGLGISCYVDAQNASSALPYIGMMEPFRVWIKRIDLEEHREAIDQTLEEMGLG